MFGENCPKACMLKNEFPEFSFWLLVGSGMISLFLSP